MIPLEGQGGRLYGLFRDLLHRAGYDAANFGTPEWNPLGAIVAGRRRIVIKPNLVLIAWVSSLARSRASWCMPR